MERIPEQIKDQAKSDIVDVIGRRIKLVRQGNLHVACCPFHKEETPSFKVDKRKGSFRCYGCGASGDAISFVMRLNSLAFHEAVLSITGGSNEPAAPRDTTSVGRQKDIEDDAFAPIFPAPENAGRPAFAKLFGGTDYTFIKEYAYRDETGQLLFYVARYNHKTKIASSGKTVKSTPAICYGTIKNGKKCWKAKSGGKQILYGLDRLAARPDAPVIVFEGEKDCDAGVKIFPDYVCVGLKGGAGNATRLDLSPLEGRRVVLWPDADPAGRAAMEAVARGLLTKATVQVVGISDAPSGWGVADTMPVGWTATTLHQLVQAAPLYREPPAAPEPVKQRRSEGRRRRPVVAQEGAPTYPRPTLSLAEAEQALAAAVDTVIKDLRSYHGWPGEQGIEHRTEVVKDKDDNETIVKVFDPRLINVTMGVGKTRSIIDLVNTLPDDCNINIAVQDTTLVDELVKELRSKTRRKIIALYGRTAIDPDCGSMCRMADIVKKIQAFSNIEGTMCKKLVKNGDPIYCEGHPETPTDEPCQYQKNKLYREPAVRVGTHAQLGLGAASPFPKAHLTIIDESAENEFLAVKEFTLRDLMTCICPPNYEEIVSRSFESSKLPQDKIDNIIKKRVSDAWYYHQNLIRFFAGQNTNRYALPMTPKALTAMLMGITKEKAESYATAWRASLPDTGIRPDLTREDKNALADQYIPGFAYEMGRLWGLVAEYIDSPAESLQCFRVTKSKLIMRYHKKPIIDGPVVLLDGTADLISVKRDFGERVVVTDIKTEHEEGQAYVIQVTDTQMAQTKVGYDLREKYAKDEKLKRAAKKMRKKLAILSEVETYRAIQSGKGKVCHITYKAMRAEYPELAKLGCEIGWPRADGQGYSGHNGAGRGFNGLNDYDCIIDVGRLLPPIHVIDDEAHAKFGGPTEKEFEPLPLDEKGEPVWIYETKYLRLRSGEVVPVENPTLPDERRKAVLKKYVETNIEQEIARARALRRSKDRPVRILLLTDTCVNVTVDEPTTLDDLLPSYAELMIARGVVPMTWKGRAAVVKDYMKAWGHNEKDRPLWGLAQDLRDSEQDDPEAWENLITQFVGITKGDSFLTNSYKLSGWTLYRYRLSGERQGGQVWVSDIHASPQDAVEAHLGPLDVFEPVEVVPPAKVQESPPAPAQEPAKEGESMEGESMPPPVEPPPLRVEQDNEPECNNNSRLDADDAETYNKTASCRRRT